MLRALDAYLRWPLLADLLVAGLLCLLLHYAPAALPIATPETALLQNSLANTAVALAGAALAALTIIGVFKKSIDFKKIDQATDKAALPFNGSHYGRLVRVFRVAILELAGCFAAMHAAMFFGGTFAPRHQLLLAAAGLALLLLALLRCLYVLFGILDIDARPQQG